MQLVRILQWGQHSRLGTVLCIVLVISILAAVGAVVYTLTNLKVSEKFTEFYVLGPQGSAQNYPQKLVVGQPGEVVLAIVNHEQQGTYYYVRVSLDGTEIQEIGPISLAHEGKWEEKVTFVPTEAGEAQRVEFLLYKGEESAPYRDLYLWLDVEEMR